MIITKLVMNPFGCFSNKEVVFKDGLNVVLGPNEAGKSTMFHAIQNVLFTRVKLTKREIKEIERFIPIGGNTIFVEISFFIKGKAYLLRKKWGRSILEELVMPDGALITGEKDIIKFMDSILPAKQGTFKSVLMTYQTGLSKTIEELKNSYPDTIHSLGDILRRVVLETDGVSIDRFREKVERLYNEHFSHWDIKRRCPEKDRGIETPWQKEVGEILRSFYERERIRKRYHEIKDFEENYDRLNKEIEQFKRLVDEKDKYIQKYKKPLEDIEKRKSLMLQIEKIDREKEEISRVIDDWPVKEKEIEDLKKKIHELEEKKQKLEKEKKEAEKEVEYRKLKEKYEKVKMMKAELDEISKKISSRKWITKNEFKKIRDLFIESERLKRQLSSSGIEISINAKKDLNFFIKSGVSDIKSKILKAGELFSIKAEGIAQIIHDSWEIRVSADVKNVHDLIKRIKELEENLENVKRSYSINTFEEIEQLYIDYEKLLDSFNIQKKLFESELGEYTFDKLETEIKKIKEIKISKSLVDIISEYESVKHEVNKCTNEIKKDLEILNAYKEKYKTRDNLLFRYTELTNEAKKLNERLKALEPIPEDIKDIEGFILEYENCRKECEKAKDELFKLRNQKALMEGRVPDESLEEITALLKDAEEEFNRVLKRGYNILRIKEYTDKLLNEIDDDTYSGMRKSLEYYISKITDKRYEEISMDGWLPKGILRDDRKFLPIDFLSIGTRDMLLLSLRLSMANYFLDGEDGFLLMDDPLVNLDPGRQLRAGELLRDFAKDKQVIIFTCNPEHARLLNGNLIDIEYCS